MIEGGQYYSKKEKVEQSPWIRLHLNTDLKEVREWSMTYLPQRGKHVELRQLLVQRPWGVGERARTLVGQVECWGSGQGSTVEPDQSGLLDQCEEFHDVKGGALEGFEQRNNMIWVEF